MRIDYVLHIENNNELKIKLYEDIIQFFVEFLFVLYHN